jgi:hypothetical protein
MKDKQLITLLAAAVFVISLAKLWASATEKNYLFAQYPDNFIPFWSEDKGGYETQLLNTNQIVSITPVFEPMEEKKSKRKNVLHLRVELTNGKSLLVYEDFEEFYDRVRVSQAK